MAVTIGHASIDENKNIKGGAAGDQTGKEVCTRSWYSKPWTSVIRPKDSAKAEKIAKAMEQALRRYNGKAMINSVNGKKESMEAVFPLVKKYGGLVVALTLDESGIPDTAEGRIAIAEKILKKAEKFNAL